MDGVDEGREDDEKGEKKEKGGCMMWISMLRSLLP